VGSDERLSGEAAALIQRIPVFLLTGYLGSGKTSLLKTWLGEPEFAQAALVINELGEVGLDNQLLSFGSESSTLIANGCVCCSGLPGLAEALEGLFWARLEKRIPRFPCVVIETTGLAEPAPVLAAMQASTLLAERFEIAGVITCLSAVTAATVLERFGEARSQLEGADVLILTKTDLVSADFLATAIPTLIQRGARCDVLSSANASLSVKRVLNELKNRRQRQLVLNPDHDPADKHHDNAKAFWLPVTETVSMMLLHQQIAAMQDALGRSLLRLKGLVVTDEGPRLVQLSPLETKAIVTIVTIDDSADKKQTVTGLTLIASLPLTSDQLEYLEYRCFAKSNFAGQPH
jgi:G3E family GTPase